MAQRAKGEAARSLNEVSYPPNESMTEGPSDPEEHSEIIESGLEISSLNRILEIFIPLTERGFPAYT